MYAINKSITDVRFGCLMKKRLLDKIKNLNSYIKNPFCIVAHVLYLIADTPQITSVQYLKFVAS